MTSSWLTLVNPAAARGRHAGKVQHALEALRQQGWKLQVHETRGPNDASEVARAACREGQTRFLVAGGDGTLFETLNGALDSGKSEGLEVGVLPTGTGNSFLRDFGIFRLEDALDALLRGGSRRLDAVHAQHAGGSFHFVNLLSFGFSARVGAHRNQHYARWGQAGYVLSTLQCVPRLDAQTIQVGLDEGGSDAWRVALLSFCNTRFTGGSMMMAPAADPSDGALDIVRVGDIGALRLLSTFPRIFAGSHVGRPGVSQSRAKRIDFHDIEEQDLMVDGEILRARLRSLEVRPSCWSLRA